LHESVVHGLLSLQLGAAPPTHAPPEHVSAVVHALPSSHAAVLFACVQPLAGAHASLVHGLLSLQLGAAPPTHEPPAHVSAVVHALPSLQGEVLFACTQPVAGLHESSVHPLLSLQFVAPPPTHAPPEHVSPVVHASPSLQATVLFVCTQPVTALHESVVHTLPSLQFGAAPGVQVPVVHVSPTVHALPSLHGTALRFTQLPEPLHCTQSFGFPPPQLVLQHTPSTQVRPPAHIVSRLHEPPAPSWGMQVFVFRSQNVPGAVQSESTPQAP
jgi:hypothetical protein